MIWRFCFFAFFFSPLRRLGRCLAIWEFYTLTRCVPILRENDMSSFRIEYTQCTHFRICSSVALSLCVSLSLYVQSYEYDRLLDCSTRCSSYDWCCFFFLLPIYSVVSVIRRHRRAYFCTHRMNSLLQHKQNSRQRRRRPRLPRQLSLEIVSLKCLHFEIIEEKTKCAHNSCLKRREKRIERKRKKRNKCEANTMNKHF